MDVRKTTDAIALALVAANNARQLDNVSTTYFHLRKLTTSGTDYQAPTETATVISSANASSQSTRVALANELKTVLNLHFADDIAHNTAVSAAITTATATDDTTAIALANAIKAAYNTHRTASNVHFNNDSTNATAAVDASDATSCNTLLNELKTDVNAHLASAPPGMYLNVVPA